MIEGAKHYLLVHADEKYADEVYGYLELNDDTEKGRIILLDTYPKGLHEGFVLGMYRKTGMKVIEGDDFDYWLSLRVCPSGRHNIRDILNAYGLKEYNACKIYVANEGRTSKDDMVIKDVTGDTRYDKYFK